MRFLGRSMFALIALVFTETESLAQNVSPSEPSLLSPMEVQINDNSKDECWANSDAAKAYATSRLEEIGYKTNTGSVNVFSIYVSSAKDSADDLCFGVVRTSISKAVDVGGVKGWMTLDWSEYVFTRKQTNDDLVFKVIEQLTERMETLTIGR